MNSRVQDIHFYTEFLKKFLKQECFRSIIWQLLPYLVVLIRQTQLSLESGST